MSLPTPPSDTGKAGGGLTAGEITGGNLAGDLAAVCSRENLTLAWTKVARGKSANTAVQEFYANLDANLADIRTALTTGSYKPGTYHQFLIKDPKERVISASSVRDRVVYHALMNILEPLFERQMICHTYACRKGKGPHAAVLYAFSRCKALANKGSSAYFLKLDVRKYFDSIDHGILKSQLAHIIKDKKILTILFGVIDSYHTLEGKGVPIGNLTSQYFANLYLSSMDHYILEKLRPAAYVRYMDDFVLWETDKPKLQTTLERIRQYAEGTLRLTLKQPVLGKIATRTNAHKRAGRLSKMTGRSSGLPFLGFLIKPDGIYLLRKSKRRIKEKIREVNARLAAGLLTEEKAAESITSIHAAALLARARSFLKRIRRLSLITSQS
jgi:retron-type reverse transcriptase